MKHRSTPHSSKYFHFYVFSGDPKNYICLDLFLSTGGAFKKKQKKQMAVTAIGITEHNFPPIIGKVQVLKVKYTASQKHQ